MSELKLELKVNKSLLWIVIITFGTVLRYLCGLRPPNYDFYSWEIVADLFLDNKSVYANTIRYNYGPIWFNVLGFLRNLDLDFRFCLISFLTLIDICIFYILWNTDKIKESILFFLSPISIVISGYHNQFENFAILSILLGIFYLIKKHGTKVNFDQISFGDTVLLAACIGLSLTIKHIFILFPLWLFFQTHQFYKRIFILIIPILVFFTAFYFYWDEGKSGIITNVFGYASFNNFPFYQVVYADLFQLINNLDERAIRMFFLFLIAILGFILRKRSLLESMLFYSACFVCFAAAVANQYLVIPVLFLSFYFYSSALFYYLVGAVVLVLFDWDGLQFLTYTPPYSMFAGKLWYKIMVFFLFVNIVSAIYNRDYLMEFLAKVFGKVKIVLQDMRVEFIQFFRFK